MKKSIYDQSEPGDNMVMAALKQAVSNLKATNSMTGQREFHTLSNKPNDAKEVTIKCRRLFVQAK